jgi:hypothetical protein
MTFRKIIILFISLCFFSVQSQNFDWVKQIGGTGSENGTFITRDALGNIYTSGFYSGTATDFDPGPGTYTLSSNPSSTDIYVTKFDPNGNFIWARTAGGTGNDFAYSVAVDSSQNVYVVGYFLNTVDFDPGPGISNLTAPGTQSDFFVWKLNAAGNYVWAKQFTGTGAVWGGCVALDTIGNPNILCYASGGPNDFDPGPSTYTFSGSTWDVVITKLDTGGNFLWSGLIGGNLQDYSSKLTVDISGNVYATGNFQSVADFDPGPGVYNMTSNGGNEAFIVKLNSAGKFVWARSIGGPNGDYGTGVALSMNQDKLYFTGSYNGSGIDFDPGPATYTLAAYGDADTFITKLDSAGNFIWARSVGGYTVDFGTAACTDGSDNIYTIGYFNGTCDFDPGPSTFTLTPAGNYDIFISKLDASGNFVWATRFGGVNADYGWQCTADQNGDLYSNGYFSAPNCDFNPAVPVYNLTSMGANDAFVLKLNYCNLPPAPVDLTPAANFTICNMNSTSFYISGSGTLNWYASPTSTVPIASGTVFTTPTLSTGFYTYYAEAMTCGTSLIRVPFTVTVGIPGLAISGNTAVCPGFSVTQTASGASTYTWSTGANSNSITVTPSTTTNYTLWATAANTCTGSIVQTVSLSPVPTVTVAAPLTLCTGSGTAMFASGASSYTWSTGSMVSAIFVTPTVTTSYSVIGKNSSGCADTAYNTITVLPTPTVFIASSTYTMCNGTSLTLTATGANTYTWNTASTNTTIIVSPTVNTNYTVTGMALNGCKGLTGTSITVYLSPTVTALTSASLICAGNSVTLTTSGASTYTWSTGANTASIVVTPSATLTYTVTGSLVNGCSDSATVTQNVSTCVGISESLLTGEFEVYPNPTYDRLYIHINSAPKKIRITDAIGKIYLETIIAEQKAEIDLLEWAEGIYYLSVGSENVKLIKLKR